jgi:hypothetical protein
MKIAHISPKAGDKLANSVPVNPKSGAIKPVEIARTVNSNIAKNTYWNWSLWIPV